MINVDKLPAKVLESLQQRHISTEQIAGMSPAEIFEEHCVWNGLYGYGFKFFEEVKALIEAENES